MSYSFNITATSKQEAKDLVRGKFDEVLVTQPAHAADREAAIAATEAFIDLMADSTAAGKRVIVVVYGSLVQANVDGSGNPAPTTGASVSVSVSVV